MDINDIKINMETINELLTILVAMILICVFFGLFALAIFYGEKLLRKNKKDE